MTEFEPSRSCARRIRGPLRRDSGRSVAAPQWARSATGLNRSRG